MTQQEITDADAAYGWTQEFVATVADEHDWTEMEESWALDDVDAAYDAADDADWWGADAETFWSKLYELAADWTMDNAADMRATFAAAAGTVGTVDATTSLEAYAGFAEQAVVDTFSDLGEAAEEVGDAVTDWRWLAGAAALAGILAYTVL